MAKEKINVVRIDTDPAKKSLKDLRKEILELKNQMANLDEDSDAFGKLANQAGDLKHQLDEINQRVRGSSSDFGDMVGNVANLTAGLVGAFSAVQGGLQAMGVESEAVDETIKRMQGLMAVVQGLTSIDGAIDAMNDLRNAITSTSGAAKILKTVLQPKVFLAITAVIAALTAAWHLWGEDLRKSIPALDKFMKKWDGTAAKEAERIAEAQRKFNEELAVSNKEVAEILKNRKWNAITKEAQDRIKFLEEEIKIYENKVKNIVKQQEGATEAEWNRLNQIGIGYLEQIRLWKAEIDDLYNNPKYQLSNQPETPAAKKTKEEILAEMGLVEFTDQDLAEGLERIKKYWEGVYDIKLEQNKRSKLTDAEKLTEEISIEQQRLTLYKEGTLEYEKQLTHIFNLENELKELIGDSTEVVKTKIDQVRELGNATFDTLKDTMGMFGDSSLGLTTGWVESLDIFQDAFLQTMDIVKEKGKSTWTAYGNVVATSLNGIGSMLNALSQEQDASNEDGFKQMKNLQIAATVMNMLSGVMSAWTSAMNPANSWMTLPGQIAMGTATSAMVAGIGAAQIAKIKSQTMTSANPNFNINAKSAATSAMIVPPVQYSNAVQGANTEGAIRDSKVYVTETDIKNTMNKVSVQENENIY